MWVLFGLLRSLLPGHSCIVHSVHLERLGSLPEDVVRFYVAEVGSALAFLHEHRIIHRLVAVDLALFSP